MELQVETESALKDNLGAGIDLDEVDAERQRVLVVEDEFDTIFCSSKSYVLPGLVLSASSGQEALKKLVDHKADLVLLDLMMPDMDGWETLKHMRQMTDCAVIIVSAMAARTTLCVASRMVWMIT